MPLVASVEDAVTAVALNGEIQAAVIRHDLPLRSRDRLPLMTGAQCPNQAYRAGASYGFQCHFEVSTRLWLEWMSNMSDSLKALKAFSCPPRSRWLRASWLPQRALNSLCR